MRVHHLSLLYFFALGLTVAGCGDNPTVDTTENPVEAPIANKDGATITGLVLPPGVGPQVIVLRNAIDFTNTIADEEGRYTISNLPGGDYSLEVIASGFFTDISINNLQLKAGDTHEAGLVILREQAQGATILGQVVDKSNDQPLPEVEVQVECSTGVCAPLSAESDQEGRFSIDLWSGLASNINVRKFGFRTKPIPVQALEPGQKFNLKQVQLERVAQ
jgi:hypothetical protein